ncbi:1235_t:CDS:10 [Ambispora gerdemannii]|uniref:1235_t:CDS:1 n=1 Tax=Ambispora gerdemannii TaxID=144530 RepID=A0A9N9A140_9GLOM|nr:1235_t:CDS:10 [Ambispora gerdemannii]
MNNPDTDLESVRHEYRAQLSELTFNSKPIITNLTIIAQENIHVARAIVQAIEDQIKVSLPPQKLPVLYLLDSISKNVGGVYITLFSHNLLHTFIDAYHAVDDATKQKFERVLNTWKVGPNGGPVYPLDVTTSIERALIKQQQMRYQSRGSIDGRNHIHINPNFLAGIQQNQNSLNNYQQPQQTPQTSQTLITSHASAPLSHTLPLTQQPQSSQPQWADNAHYTNDGGGAGANSYTSTSTTTHPSRQGYYSTQTVSFIPPPDQARLIQEYRALLSQRQQYALQNAGDPNNQVQIQTLQGLLDLFQMTTLTPDQIQQLRQQISNYIGASANRTNINHNGVGVGVGDVRGVGGVVGGTTPPIVVSVTGSMLKELGKIQLTSSDIQKKREGAIAILYDAFPLQCKQCGFRYAKTGEGKAKMDAHLDWHFRQNRRMKDKAKTAQSRNWFVIEEDWVYSRESEINTIIHSAAYFEPAPSSSVSSSTPKKSAPVTQQQPQQSKEEEVMNESTVIVPLDWEKMSKPCPICQEKFKKYYSDADDEWIFKNAVEIDGVIYHASCYADVAKNQETTQSSSRESTPSSVLGKRKAEESQPEVLEVQKRPALVS